MSAIRILIVDDHAVVRAGLRALLDEQPGMGVTGEAGRVADALALLQSGTYDLLLLDLNLPDGTGWDMIASVRRRWAALPILVLSAYREDQHALQALKAGADGFLNKETAPEFLIAAVRKVASGGKYVSERVAEQLARGVAGASGVVHDRLSEREFRVLQMIASGHSLVAIGEALHVSPKTITTYRARVLDKLDLANNADITRYALENGLLE